MAFPPDPELNKFAVNNASYTAIPFTVAFRERDPTFSDVNYPVQKIWLNKTTNVFWFLRNFYLMPNSYFAANWIKMGGANIVESLRDQTGVDVFPDPTTEINVVGDGVYIKTVGDPATHTLTIEPAGGLTTLYTENTGTATPMAGNLNVLGTVPITTTGSGNTITIATNGTLATTYLEDTGSATPSGGILNVIGGTGILTSGSGNTITITSTGIDTAPNYTNVTHAMSPYTVNVTTPPLDFYISVDCSGGTVQLNFPNAPTFKQLWIIKDRTGNAAVNNITLTTPGGTVTIDGLTTYTMNSNYQAINLLANAIPTYEVY